MAFAQRYFAFHDWLDDNKTRTMFPKSRLPDERGLSGGNGQRAQSGPLTWLALAVPNAGRLDFIRICVAFKLTTRIKCSKANMYEVFSEACSHFLASRILEWKRLFHQRHKIHPAQLITAVSCATFLRFSSVSLKSLTR